jgi:hypothetical protein
MNDETETKEVRHPHTFYDDTNPAHYLRGMAVESEAARGRRFAAYTGLFEKET